METTPIIVGVGQWTERIDDASYRGLSPVELAAEAARRALDDAEGRGVAAAIDAVVTTRTFEDSLPWPAPFGKSSCFPRSLAQHLGLTPRLAFWSRMGGDTPQRLVNLFAERLARGELQAVLLASAEAISSVRHLSASGQRRDWRETPAGAVTDEGSGWQALLSPQMIAADLTHIPAVYALCEHARRRRLGLSRGDYALQMGALFAPLTALAAQNPLSAARQAPATAAELATPGPHNRLIADPYPLRLVARDQVNQGAALLLTTVATARRLGIAPQRWVFLHGYAEAAEKPLLQRADLGAYPAGVAASQAALSAAGVGVDQLQHFDFYSCFPIAVSSVAQDGLGLADDDPRGLSVTGGLPYFGGPGNGYSTHAIASMVDRLRAAPGALGFVGANGGFLSKYAAGVYASEARPWRPCDSAPLQARLDAVAAPRIADAPHGRAVIETATVVCNQGQPSHAFAIAQMRDGSGRVLARSGGDDRETPAALLQGELIGREISVAQRDGQNRFVLLD